MLIILNGPQTTSKAAIGRELMAAFNTFEIGGYKIDLSQEQVNIYNSAGKHVYSSVDVNGEPLLELVHNEDGSLNQAGDDILTQAFELQQAINAELKDNHYYNIFNDDQYDWGLTAIINAPMNGEDPGYEYKWPHTYDDILSNYNNRKHDTQVISGSFSKHFVTSIMEDLGEENVKVLNIIRNPSAVYVANERSLEERKMTPAGPLDKGRHRRILVRSITSSILVGTIPSATTIRYEDILAKSTFKFLGKDVQCPVITNEHNGIITAQEKATVEKRDAVNDTAVNDFNQRYQNFNMERAEEDTNGQLVFIDFLDFLSKKPANELAQHQIDAEKAKERLAKIPKNLFAALGYTPLAYSEIVDFTKT